MRPLCIYREALIESAASKRAYFDSDQRQYQRVRIMPIVVSAEHDQVIAPFALLSAMGRLSIINPGVAVAQDNPKVHFDQLKDKWVGLRTPDGK